MKVGYMTNAWGSVVGHPAGVGSVKDLFYLSTGSDQEAITSIAEIGFKAIEIFDGNLMNYANDKETFKKLLNDNKVKLLGVYSAANFIFEEIIEEEFYKLEQAAKIAGEFGAKHFVVGGGAIRSEGILEEDYKVMAEGLDRVVELAERYNLIASYHPHLGTIVQSPEQLDKLMPLTKINLCPDLAHLEAGGGDSIKIVETYKDRIKYVHLKDFAGGKFLPLGQGKIELEKVIEILKNNNFDGEFLVEADGAGEPKAAATESYEYLTKRFNLTDF